MTGTRQIRALVIDDEPLARGLIREMLESDPEAEIVGECANGCDAISSIRSLSPDLIFLDVQMPELGGFEVLESLQEGELPAIIFVTAYDQYAVRAFDVHALDYLLKPFDRQRFCVAWERAKARLFEGEINRHQQRILTMLEELRSAPQYIERLVIKAEGRVFFLDSEDIHYIEAEGNYVGVHNGKRAYLLRETIGRLEAQLNPKEFLRIHRSAIVRIDRIKELQPWFHGEYRVILDGGKQLMLSRNYRAKLQAAVGNAL